jgi:hypothetical protein
MTESLLGGASAAPVLMRATAVVASAVVRAARRLFTDLERGRRIDATALRNAMEAAFGASDAIGAWNWKTAYEACEAATFMFLRRHGAAMRVKAASPAAMLPLLMRIAGLLPTHTRAGLRKAKHPNSSRRRSGWHSSPAEGRTVLELAEGLQLRRVRVMAAHRIELSGFNDTMHDRLRIYRPFSEIISWKLRMFVPTDADGAEVLAKVLDRYPIERIAEWEAA